jgi:hypothetical protein
MTTERMNPRIQRREEIVAMGLFSGHEGADHNPK